jgi:ACS family hexuronate transporter-like MFS transporter
MNSPGNKAVVEYAPSFRGEEVLPTFRWVVCGLLFFATTINYMDRQVIGILASPLQKELGWSESNYGWIIGAFQAGYAVGMLLCGRLIDRVGTRIGYALGITVWSVAAAAHGLLSSAFGFGAARFALGVGEASNFPAAVKTVAEWFPQRERALATGLFNSGSNIGAVLAPLLVPFIALRWGWRWAFFLTGGLGFAWLALWLLVYRRPSPRARPVDSGDTANRAPSVAAEPPIAWSKLLAMRETWALGLARFATDPIWWFYLYWLPKFLKAEHGVVLDKLGPPLVAIYLAADVGSIAGGYLSSALMKRGWQSLKARKAAMLVSAVCVTPMIFAARISGLWQAVALVGLAAAAHQGWSANLYTIVSDMYPQRAVASMIGLCGFFGSAGGIIFSVSTGLILQRTGLYSPMFFMCGVAYLIGLAIIHMGTRGSVETEAA